MTNKNKLHINSALQLLEGTGISILDAARIVKNILDFKPVKTKNTNVQFCSKIVDTGIKHLCIKEISIEKAFKQYLEAKSYLRKDSFNTIRYIGSRLLNANRNIAKMNFSELTLPLCQKWLSSEFNTPTQFNKAHTMLHGFLHYGLCQEWIGRNILKLIPRKKVVEKEIKALSIDEIKALIKASNLPKFANCKAPLAILLWAGIRPTELTRLKWHDIDLEENIITIRPQTSKTGGSRHIEIPKILNKCLKKIKYQQKEKKALFSDSNPYFKNTENDAVAPPNWQRQFKALRQKAGLSHWTQDVLRHTYASYHTKCFGDLQRLQLNMGHTDLNLLRTRYINLYKISKQDAKNYFNIAC